MSLLAHFCDFKNLTFCCRSGKFLLVQFPKKSASLVAHVHKILFSKNDIETLKNMSYNLQLQEYRYIPFIANSKKENFNEEF